MKVLLGLICILLLSVTSHAQIDQSAVAIKAAKQILEIEAKTVEGELIEKPTAQLYSSFGDGGWEEKAYLISQKVRSANSPVGRSLVFALVELDVMYLDKDGNELKTPEVAVRNVFRVDLKF